MTVTGPVETSKQAHGIVQFGHFRTGLFRLQGILTWKRALACCLLFLGLNTSITRADLDLEPCVGAWLEVRAWVDDLEIPDSAQAHGGTNVPEGSAVCVILRHRGRTVGVGRALPSTPRMDGESLVLKAVEEAIELARHDDVISSLPASVQREAGRHLTLEMEIAGPTQALLGRSFRDATQRLQPGVDGLAMRHGDRWWFHFPSHLRLTNAVVGPDRLYSFALASELSPQQINTLRTQGDIGIYRFSSINLAQSKPDGPPVLLTSGNLPVFETDVTDDRLVEARDSLARHILERIFTTDDQVRLAGPFLPSSEGFDQKPPSPRDRFLVALALARYSNTAGADPALALETRVAAKRLLESTDSTESPDPELDPTTTAAWCLAADELELKDRESKRQQVRTFVQNMVEADDALLRKNAHDLAMTAAALAGSSDSDQQLAIHAGRRAREVLPIQQHLALLPWLGWINLSNNPGSDNQQSKADQTAMWLIRDQVLGIQMSESIGQVSSLDSGGFHLQPGPGGITAQSLRPGIFLVETSIDPAYTDPERDDEIQQGTRRFLRYLLQLTCHDDVAGTWKQPDRVRGGIRNATWDAKLHPVAQAMGLIVLSTATSSR